MRACDAAGYKAFSPCLVQSFDVVPAIVFLGAIAHRVYTSKRAEASEERSSPPRPGVEVSAIRATSTFTTHLSLMMFEAVFPFVVLLQLYLADDLRVGAERTKTSSTLSIIAVVSTCLRSCGWLLAFHLSRLDYFSRSSGWRKPVQFFVGSQFVVQTLAVSNVRDSYRLAPGVILFLLCSFFLEYVALLVVLVRVVLRPKSLEPPLESSARYVSLEDGDVDLFPSSNTTSTTAPSSWGRRRAPSGGALDASTTSFDLGYRDDAATQNGSSSVLDRLLTHEEDADDVDDDDGLYRPPEFAATPPPTAIRAFPTTPFFRTPSPKKKKVSSERVNGWRVEVPSFSQKTNGCVVFDVQLRVGDSDASEPFRLSRPFKDFKAMRNALESEVDGAHLPRRAKTKRGLETGSKGVDVIEDARERLREMLAGVLQDEALAKSRSVQTFVCEAFDEAETVRFIKALNAAEYRSEDDRRAESGTESETSSFGHSVGESELFKGFDV